jgi:hypothetical protein
MQKIAIGQIARCIRPGGLYLTSEGWQDGYEGLNLAREREGLAPMKMVDYNLLISRTEFERTVAADFEIEDYLSLGFYLFLSRVVQPKLVAPDAPRHDHPLNRAAAQLHRTNVGQAFRDCDYAGVYVLRRK